MSPAEMVEGIKKILAASKSPLLAREIARQLSVPERAVSSTEVNRVLYGMVGHFQRNTEHRWTLTTAVPQSSVPAGSVSANPQDAPARKRSSVASTGAKYARELQLKSGSSQDVEYAAEALRQEQRVSAEWKKLQCSAVEVEDEAEKIFRLEIGPSSGADQAWEGGLALRLAREDELSVGGESDTEVPASALWSGRVVAVDDVAGALYVAAENGSIPTRGFFYVRPFDFTALLVRLYTSERGRALWPLLSSRLLACLAGVKSQTSRDSQWSMGWNILWGPPGTGKTHQIGDRVAKLLADPKERVLVVSTTNDATDQVAFSIGRAVAGIKDFDSRAVLRVGRGARFHRYAERKMQHLLEDSGHMRRQELDLLRQAHLQCADPGERARLQHQIAELSKEIRGSAVDAASDASRRVVITTAFGAMALVGNETIVDESSAPFTTVILDEAGLLSRATAAALSLLAARRVVLAGDPRQLAPISRMGRLLLPSRAKWLGASALHHLDPEVLCDGVELLSKQYRMHPHIRAAVSAYQYGGRLTDEPGLGHQVALGLPEHRAIWYVLDEEKVELHRLRAERGEGNRSWVRRHTPELLQSLFSAIPALLEGSGLFLSPFVGQARTVMSWIQEKGVKSWRSSTVHQQQGAEADFVIFDTVNAGSHGWPPDEWERLTNVAASRARKLFILLATRDEAAQPFLAPMVVQLWPAALAYIDRSWRLREMERKSAQASPTSFLASDVRLGAQLARRKALHPIMSAEQQRLARFEMDGKPRLIRGVAGSGKTMVLASWLVQLLLRPESATRRYWIVFANEALSRLIQRCIQTAWERAGQTTRVPWERIDLRHIGKLLAILEAPVKVTKELRFEYDRRAEQLLLKKHRTEQLSCDAIFLDEAQDLGPSTIELLATMVRHGDPEQPKSRSINIFYDNAQNVYGRGTPKWVDMGIDLRGRSVVMKESFRSTRPITELALNILSRFLPFDEDSDQREYAERGLIQKTTRGGKPWWRVHYSEVDGPAPQVALFKERRQEIAALGQQIVGWIRDEAVEPKDITIVTMGYSGFRRMQELVVETLTPILRRLDVHIEHRTSEGFEEVDRTVVVSTPHSFKGYEAEIVCVVGADAFHAQGKVNAAQLYVALTRARSVLYVSACRHSDGMPGQIFAVLEEMSELSTSTPRVDDEGSPPEAAQRSLLDAFDG